MVVDSYGMELQVFDSTLHPRLQEQFKTLLSESCDVDLVKMEFLPGDASRRKYFRLHHNEGTLIGVYGDDNRENHSFIYFCKHFYSRGLPVPKLYASSVDQRIYIVEDLGDETLAEKISDPSISREETVGFYIQSVKDLVDFQILGHIGLDYENNCHQSPVFDRKNVEEDLQYFMKNFFIIARDYSKIPGVEDELNKLTEILVEPQPMFFLYRDFQCRNIVVRRNGDLGYVDFQAGRHGPLQYDVATLLYASKATISDKEREIILVEYLNQLERVITLRDDLKEVGMALNLARRANRNNFLTRYYFFVVFRILRALGVYMFLAVQEGHWRFLEAVPPALQNLKGLFSKHRFLGEISPQLQKFAKRLSAEESFLSPIRLKELIGSH